MAMSYVQTNPRHRDLLERLGLRAADDFLGLPAVIVSGHPTRNVARIALGPVPAFLKREHCVRWSDRISSWIAGFGFASKSGREALTLQTLEQAGVGCPEWIAFGEDGRGRAFVVVRALTDAIELREYLQRLESPAERRRLARRLGVALAHMHAAGFDHPDLYAKHVFVRAEGESFCFIDWQRSIRGRPDERRRVRDLAILNATLAEECATSRERLACLSAYAAVAGGFALAGDSTSVKQRARKVKRRLAFAVNRESARLLTKRPVREARSPAGPAQELIWLDGEALCITQEFLQELNGQVPDWLRLERTAENGSEMSQSLVTLPSGRRGLLVRGRRDQPLRWLWTEFRRKPMMTPEVREAGLLFRRQRRGEPVPRLLAFGQRRTAPWRTESFLLTEVPTADAGRTP
jgi:tRNA A-37 threonylcarbamoyl transferase component Bud32